MPQVASAAFAMRLFRTWTSAGRDRSRSPKWTTAEGPAWAAVIVSVRMAAVMNVRNMMVSFGGFGLVHPGPAWSLFAPVGHFVPAGRRRIVCRVFESWMVERGILGSLRCAPVCPVIKRQIRLFRAAVEPANG